MKLSARLLALPLLIFGLLLTGCDSSGGDDDDNGLPIEGNWEQVNNQGTPLYLEITSNTITQYENYNPGECYQIDESEIVERNGNEYTLERRDNGETDTFTITVEGDELTVQSGSDVLVFEETNIDPSEFELC